MEGKGHSIALELQTEHNTKGSEFTGLRGSCKESATYGIFRVAEGHSKHDKYIGNGLKAVEPKVRKPTRQRIKDLLSLDLESYIQQRRTMHFISVFLIDFYESRELEMQTA